MDIEAELARLLARVACTETVSSRARSCVVELERLLQKIDPSLQLRVFGSFGNGMCLNTSDLDVTCYGAHAASRPSLDVLCELRSLLEEHDKFTVSELISGARVPILKLKFDGSLDVDISCNNTEPFRNTQLLRAYSDLTPVIRELLVLVKTWAKAAGVVGAKDGNLSSYSLTLMAIYFMQVDPRVNLPCLPVGDFDGGIEIPRSAKFTCNLLIPRTALLYMFFSFYAYEFNWGEEVVAMHLGRRTSRYDPIHGELSDICYPRLHVSDPFLKDRNLNCVLKAENEVWLYNEMKSAADALHVGIIPAGLSVASGTIESESTASDATSQHLQHMPCSSSKDASPPLPSLHCGFFGLGKDLGNQFTAASRAVDSGKRSMLLAADRGNAFHSRESKNNALGTKGVLVRKGNLGPRSTHVVAPEVSDIPLPRLGISMG
eukprot:TRINITY_DN5212_c0_g1_i2.p1 TRINITY_DN5212_c0_g1~~TRINITY_DN5212_c0_g1_i2.p1  ORF type:complete len:451 (+),score=44.85 TRINITY_DN5212_c0_g1_i2:56-1354(+)